MAEQRPQSPPLPGAPLPGPPSTVPGVYCKRSQRDKQEPGKDAAPSPLVSLSVSQLPVVNWGLRY